MIGSNKLCIVIVTVVTLLIEFQTGNVGVNHLHVGMNRLHVLLQKLGSVRAVQTNAASVRHLEKKFNYHGDPKNLTWLNFE